MAYELFQVKAAKVSSPQLTVRGGRIFLNGDAGDILVKLGIKFCNFLWDGAGFKIAMRQATKRDENTFKVSIQEGKRGATISARSFLTYIQWQAKRPVTVAAHWNETERLLEASLPKEHIGAEEKGRDSAQANEGRPGRKSTGS